MPKMAEICSGRSLKPKMPREPKLGDVFWLQRLKKTSGNAVGGKRLISHKQNSYYLVYHEQEAAR